MNPKSLHQLIDLWKEKFPRRAKGGEYALHGFRYHLMVALRDAVRNFLNVQNTEPNVLIEQISDICEKCSDDTIIFTQVKRIGRTVNKALEELWEIYTLSLEYAPSLSSQLQYRILCAEWKLKNIKRAIDRWEPIESFTPSLLQSFKERVSCATDPNPFDEVLALVTQLDADNPFGKVLYWIGLLTDPNYGYIQVWSDLVELQRKQQKSGIAGLRLWSPGDRSPQTVEQGPVLPGFQPRPIHLRKGYFCDRPVYDELAGETVQWLLSNPWESDFSFRVPMLWISGRSGCGKSVAMLHILSRLHEDGIGPIIWLGNNISLLPKAVRRTPGMAGPNDQIIIAFDDPYIPRAQSEEEIWREALSALHLLHDRNTDCPPPILLCCGPTSQASRFKEDFGDNIFIKRLTVPHTLEDRNVLETWYQKRTGKKPPCVSPGDLLLVQLFFEWQLDESFSSFARRFKKRLEAEDPSEIILEGVYRIVCANRLYVGYQQNALNHLSPTQRDTFEFLIKEHHFAIDEDPKRSGIWLTHPQIANGLFETWFPRNSKLHQRQAVLKATILDGLRHGVTPRDQTALLWAVARLSDAEAPFCKRLARNNLEVVLQEVYAGYRSENNGTLDLKYLPAWIEIRFSYPNLVLSPDPLVEGLTQILPDNKEKTGFRLTCHKLLEHSKKLTKQEQLEVQGCIENLLVHTQGWKEWAPIAIDGIRRTSSPKVRKIFEQWLMDGENKESSIALSWFNLRQDLGQNSNWLLDINEKWLQQHGDSIGAGAVLSSLLKRNDLGEGRYSVASIAFDWLQNRERNPLSERVLRRLLGIPMSDEMSQKAFRLALDYVKETELHASSSFLLAAILRSRVVLKAGALKEEAIKLGQMWLRSYSDNPGFCYIADRFLRLSGISDSDWIIIATMSLDRLSDVVWFKDMDYTLQSLLRRRHLLSKKYDIQLYDLICVWLKRVEQEINQLLNRPKPAFHIVAKKLASALPLVAQIGDFEWLTAFEAKAKKIRKRADRGASDKFDRELWRLFKSHAWPNYSIGRAVLGRLGLMRKEGKTIAKLNILLTNSTNAIDLSLQEILDEAYQATETAIAEANFKGAGFLLGKMLPLSARFSEEFLDKVILLAHYLMDSSVPVSVRCGLMLECDKHIEQNRWPQPEIAYTALQRSRLDTPKTLEFLAQTNSSAIQESVPRSLDFLETLFKVLPIRVGLFLPPLMVAAEISDEKASRESCRQLVIKFLESPKVPE